MPVESLGDDFVVNAKAANAGVDASVAGHADGTFLVTWSALTEPFIDGDSSNSFDIIARAFRDGVALSGDVLVNAEQTDGQFNPQVSDRPGGSYIVAYESGEANRLPGTYAASRMIGTSGNPVGDEQLGDYSYYHRNPDIAVAGDGRYVVVSSQEDTYEARVHAADGTIVDLFSFGYGGREASATTLGGAGYLLFWSGFASEAAANPEDGTEAVSGLYAQVRSLDGDAGAPFMVTESIFALLDPSARLLANGDVAVTWTEGGGVFAAVLSPDGAMRTPPFPVGDMSVGQSEPELAALDTGGFVVVWQDDALGDGSGSAVKARLFDAAGTPDGDAIVVNQDAAGDQLSPSVAGIGEGRFVVTWTDGDGVQARIFDFDDGSGVPTGTIVSTDLSETLQGTSGRDVFLFDTAVGLGFGTDTIRNFAAGDRIVTTSRLYDANEDGRISANSSDRFQLPDTVYDAVSDTGSLKVFTATGVVSNLRLVGEFANDGITYHSYAAAGDTTDWLLA